MAGVACLHQNRITCSCCNVLIYVGKTCQHLHVRFKESLSKKGLVKEHHEQCIDGNTGGEFWHIGYHVQKILLLTLEVQWIR